MFVRVIYRILQLLFLLKQGFRISSFIATFFLGYVLLLFITLEKARKNGKYSNVKWRKDLAFF